MQTHLVNVPHSPCCQLPRNTEEKGKIQAKGKDGRMNESTKGGVRRQGGKESERRNRKREHKDRIR